MIPEILVGVATLIIAGAIVYIASNVVQHGKDIACLQTENLNTKEFLKEINGKLVFKK